MKCVPFRIALTMVVALVVVSCGSAVSPSLDPRTSTGSSSAEPPLEVVPRCEALPDYTAPADAYRNEPIYVANEMPTEAVRDWAMTQPGFQDLWIDRDHHGWIAVAFSQDAAARQVDLETQFPGVGVVAVPVDWSRAELEQLQAEVMRELSPLFEVGSGIDILKGATTIQVGILSDDRMAVVQERFAGKRVCVSGADPGDVPPAGPQPIGGDGWRLLGAEDEVGHSYRTGVAWDVESYRTLWADAGITGPPPDVDFASEVAIWFGAVHGSSCPGLRLDDVVVDAGRAIVHAAIINTEGLLGCTADAVPHAFVVALQRSRLPHGPFWIQLGPEDPPNGVREERTIVEVDLSEPGSVAPAGAVHPDDRPPRELPNGPGDVIEPGFPAMFRMRVHCGAEWLGPLNDVTWRTDEADGQPDWIPVAWQPLVDADQAITLEVLLEEGPEPMLRATANNHEVVYRPTAEGMPGCD